MWIRFQLRMCANLVGCLLVCLAGCDGSEANKNASLNPSGSSASLDREEEEAFAEDEERFLELKAKFAEIIESASARFHPLVYKFDEDLLTKMDQAEARLSSGVSSSSKEPTAPRLIPELDPDEEDDHLRQSIKRWSEKTGKDFRAEIDRLKTDLAGVDQTKAFHPEFHKKFSAVFDVFVPIEVLEMRERRNRSIHQKVRELLEPVRTTHPRMVKFFEKQIADPPYNDPDAKS